LRKKKPVKPDFKLETLWRTGPPIKAWDELRRRILADGLPEEITAILAERAKRCHGSSVRRWGLLFTNANTAMRRVNCKPNVINLGERR
jgi:hypothetical protein